MNRITLLTLITWTMKRALLSSGSNGDAGVRSPSLVSSIKTSSVQSIVYSRIFATFPITIKTSKRSMSNLRQQFHKWNPTRGVYIHRGITENSRCVDLIVNEKSKFGVCIIPWIILNKYNIQCESTDCIIFVYFT